MNSGRICKSVLEATQLLLIGSNCPRKIQDSPALTFVLEVCIIHSRQTISLLVHYCVTTLLTAVATPAQLVMKSQLLTHSTINCNQLSNKYVASLQKRLQQHYTFNITVPLLWAEGLIRGWCGLSLNLASQRVYMYVRTYVLWGAGVTVIWYPPKIWYPRYHVTRIIMVPPGTKSLQPKPMTLASSPLHSAIHMQLEWYILLHEQHGSILPDFCIMICLVCIMLCLVSSKYLTHWNQPYSLHVQLAITKSQVTSHSKWLCGYCKTHFLFHLVLI